MATVQIRRARAEDGPAVAALLVELGYPVSPETLSPVLTQAIESPDFMVLLATDPEDRPVGLLTLAFRPALRLQGIMASIEECVVCSEARGRGIGRRLLDEAKALARARQCLRLELHTNRARESYRRGFYQQHGFREVDSALLRWDALR